MVLEKMMVAACGGICICYLKMQRGAPVGAALIGKEEPVPDAGGVVGPKYRATRALRGPRALCAEVGRGRAVCAYPGRSVGRSGSSRTLAYDVHELEVHEHFRTFMNTLHASFVNTDCAQREVHEPKHNSRERS